MTHFICWVTIALCVPTYAKLNDCLGMDDDRMKTSRFLDGIFSLRSVHKYINEVLDIFKPMTSDEYVNSTWCLLSEVYDVLSTKFNRSEINRLRTDLLQYYFKDWWTSIRQQVLECRVLDIIRLDHEKIREDARLRTLRRECLTIDPESILEKNRIFFFSKHPRTDRRGMFEFLYKLFGTRTFERHMDFLKSRLSTCANTAEKCLAEMNVGADSKEDQFRIWGIYGQLTSKIDKITHELNTMQIESFEMITSPPAMNSATVYCDESIVRIKSSFVIVYLLFLVSLL
ncbi:hypothetical protein AB6A40_006759 [Gnathostoma spinigerum]|uniref:Uncharacterized protein n=1 Tax=Gnathostoma spinigerum TaxID=75299 RepID=A0ABD6EKH2_9BILA